jgi:hypothetical protein
MTGPEHYEEAERLLAETLIDVNGQQAYNHASVVMASVHATLALAAATVSLPLDLGADATDDWRTALS